VYMFIGADHSARNAAESADSPAVAAP
jgi:hypothetical protein